MRCLLVLVAASSLWACSVEEPITGRDRQALGHRRDLEARPIGRFVHGAFDADGGVAEIIAFDAPGARALVVNGQHRAIDVLDLADPSSPALRYVFDVAPFGPDVQSVAVHEGIAAAAIRGPETTDPGLVVFFRIDDGEVLDAVPTGALPDMVTFTPDGRFAITADEGEPSDDYAIDPEGSVTVIDLSRGFPASARRATFHRFDDDLPAGVRIGHPGSLPSRDLEPEYVAVSSDSCTAWITLQENDAIAELDIRRARIDDLWPLGSADHARRRRGLDPSDRDEGIQIGRWPVRGLYMPDGIAAYRAGGDTYLVTANEGDSRERDDFTDEARLGSDDVQLDPDAFPDADALRADEALGRLKVVTTEGDLDGDGDLDELYSFGARSFAIWDDRGRQVFDSGDRLERLVADVQPDAFNASHDDNEVDGRSDDKGPEPESVVVAHLFGRDLAFVALERTSAIVVYDVTSPRRPELVSYISTRDLSVTPGEGDAGDLGPEGLTVVEPDDSPTGEALLLVAYEVSGTTRVFELTGR